MLFENENVNFTPEILHLQKDPEFRKKLSDRIEQSNGWGFTIRYNGLRIGVTAIDDNYGRTVYLEA